TSATSAKRPSPRAMRAYHGRPPGVARPSAGPTPARDSANTRDADLPRLSKRMSELGLCSRREADEWIASGWVKVDGAVMKTPGPPDPNHQHRPGPPPRTTRARDVPAQKADGLRVGTARRQLSARSLADPPRESLERGSLAAPVPAGASARSCARGAPRYRLD